jgi:hypothetical protein
LNQGEIVEDRSNISGKPKQIDAFQTKEKKKKKKRKKKKTGEPDL